jgi:Zn-dependent protease with chaperone function
MNHAEYQTRYADTIARETMSNARTTMERALAELDRYIARYEQADSLNSKADILNWTINHLATYVTSNVRLDLIARAQAELARADITR